MGAALMAGAVLATLARTRIRVALPYVMTAACLGAAALTIREVAVWRDTPTVLATMVERDPDNFRGHELMAYAARDAGRPEEAELHFRAAIARFPASSEMLTDAATVALRLRDTTTASRWLSTAVRTSPRAARARTRLYAILRARGDTLRANALLMEGLRVDPHQQTWARMLRGAQSAAR
jgi:Tfp pilus assembly protein PilF